MTHDAPTGWTTTAENTVLDKATNSDADNTNDATSPTCSPNKCLCE